VEQMVRALWPEAPVAEAAESGRWVRLRVDRVTSIYVQRYAWDEDTRPDFIVAVPTEDDERPVALRRYGDLAEALHAVRDLCESRLAT